MFSFGIRLCLFLLTHLALVAAVAELPRHSPEEALEQVKWSLRKIGSKFVENEETEGFQYRLDSTLWTPFSYSVYIGSFTPKKTIVRIDSRAGMEKALCDVILQDAEIAQFEKSYGKKYWFIGDSITLISPFFGYLYTQVNSPFQTRGFFLKSLLFLGGDLLLLWIGGKTFFTHGFDPLNRGKVATAILLGAYRFAFLPLFHFRFVAQDRLVELNYRFRF